GSIGAGGNRRSSPAVIAGTTPATYSPAPARPKRSSRRSTGAPCSGSRRRRSSAGHLSSPPVTSGRRKNRQDRPENRQATRQTRRDDALRLVQPTAQTCCSDLLGRPNSRQTNAHVRTVED